MEISFQKQIHDYLEGSLSQEQERKLFDQLSTHPEWREELNFQMRMHEAAQKDIGRVTVPASVTATLFASLGFGVPQVTKKSKLRRVLTRVGNGKPIIGMSSIALVGIALFLLAQRSEEPKQTPAPIAALLPAAKLERAESEQPRTLPTTGITKQTPPKAPLEIKVSRDLGKFSSVEHITDQKVIGIANHGEIFLSSDGGSLWTIQKSLTKKDLYGVHFADPEHGAVVGARGTILLTSDGGKHWSKVPPVTDASLIAIRFATRDTLFASGAQGTILRSTNAGKNWQPMESGINSGLFTVTFENGRIGSVSGENGVTLETKDAGLTWTKK